jgi:HD superfamily phosphohydrolase
MEFRGMESFAIEALQTPELQRLRRIRQLGMAHLVFPGAEHSRFAHVLGAAHLASRFSASLVADAHLHLPRSLQPDESIVRDLVAAALCHDLGHGPLSHAWEYNVVGELDDEKREAWTASLGLGDQSWLPDIKGWHELVTQALLLTPGRLNTLLENTERGMSERVAALLGGRFYLPYLTRLFASDVDVDRCDFILRDAHGSGVAYGRYDLDWLVSTITVGTDPANDAPVLGFDLHKAPRVVEQLLIARRALYDTVYHHRAVRSAEGMVGLLLRRTHELAALDRNFLLRIHGFDVLVKAIAGDALTTEEILELDDDSLWVFVRRLQTDVDDAAVNSLAMRVLQRDLFKPVPVSPRRLDQLITSEYEETMNKVERVLAAHGYPEPAWFRFVDHAYFSFFHTRVGEESWFIDTRDSRRRGQPIPMHEALIHHPHEERVQRTLYVPREAVGEVKNALEP